uniref:Small ribosomal subunit protein mS29 n=1 Tax=Culicoides sonorensis TaxID=179676 RepID=A0A336LXC0_CULSO
MLLRRVISSRSLPTLSYSTATATAEETKFTDFRTSEQDPTKHSEKHIGRLFYKIPENVKKVLFSQGGIPKQYEKQWKTFAEPCLMIRKPVIDLINYIGQGVSTDKPVNRYVLYGDIGAGKSLTLAHLLHYGYTAGFMLVHMPYSGYYYKFPKEHGPSATREGFWDLPLDSAAWLIRFKTQNGHLLNQPDLKISKDYVWSKRETTPAGSSLLELVDHGINRVKFAGDTIDALIEELKLLSTSGKCKVLAIIDQYNVFWQPLSYLRGPHRVRIKTENVTLTNPMRSISNYNWTNGAVVVSVDPMGHVDQFGQSPLPRCMLGKEGFEHMDPFVPIEVPTYDDKEFQNCIDYYLDRRWIQNTAEGFDKELKLLTNKNPYDLMRMCAPL